MFTKNLLKATLMLCPAIPAMIECAAAAPYPLRDAVPFTVRAGLPNVAAKLTRGESVTIAYLGGSITAQPGWRPQTLAWFREQYPGADVSQIHAAIGGTGSDLGVFRLEQDVLRHDPDLLFVEFAVNDGSAPPERIMKAMEGIVRQTWQQDATTDICFVYTLTHGMLGDLQSGKYPRAASVMEELADAYGIPSIHMGLPVARLEAEGKVIFTDKENRSAEARREAMEEGIYIFSKDGVHPHPDTGHVLYLEAVVRAMQEMLPAGEPGSHPLPPPIREDNWESATMVPLDAATLSDHWRRLDPATDPLAKRFAGRMPHLWLADTPGASVTFRFKGTRVRIYDLVGPRCGAVKVTVDGKELGTRRRFDPYCTYYRLQTMHVVDNLPDEIHDVMLEISAEDIDKRTILSKRSGPNKDVLALDDESFDERFAGKRWYAGMIMLLGNMAE